MQQVVILGAGGFAREVLDIFMAQNAVRPQYKILGFIDENQAKKSQLLNGFPILGDWEWFDTIDRTQVWAVCGVGNPSTRFKMVHRALERKVQFCNIIHPTAVITPFVSWGTGIVVTAGCIFTNQITVGDHAHVNLDCTIGHDCRIDSFCTLAPGVHVSGNVIIQEGCDIGTGAVIIQGITIGEWSVVGAGAVVTKELTPNVTAVGVPAQVIKTRQAGWQRA